MIINGIDVPDDIARDEAMKQAFLMTHKPAEPAAGGEPAGGQDGGQGSGQEPAGSGTPAGAATAPEVNWGEFGEEFKSKEDLANAITEYRSLKSKPKETSVINDPVFYRLAKLKAESPEEYPLFKKLVLDGDADPLELLSIDFIKSNPGFKGQEDKVKGFLRRQYNLNTEIPAEPDADDQSPEANRIRQEIKTKREDLEFSEMKMKADSEKVKQSLINERFEKIELPQFTNPEDVTKLREQRKDVYEKSIAPEAVKAINSLPIYIKNEKGEMVKALDFQLGDAHKKRLNELLIEFGSTLDGEVNKDHAVTAISNAMSALKDEYQAEINTIIFTSARAMVEQDYYKLYHNPAPIGAGGGGGTPPVDTKTPYEKSRDEAIRLERGGR